MGNKEDCVNAKLFVSQIWGKGFKWCPTFVREKDVPGNQ
uniref:Uncharacterized protein n=1 Tax=Anguilla anguilla TaxID=7936 RepID=A0A0E9RJ68_ANGAN